MGIIESIALFFHLIGFASLFGVAAVQVRAPVRVARNGMMHGALALLITGPILAYFEKDKINHAAAALKLLIVLIIVAILAYYRRKPERAISAKPFFIVFGLTFAEVIIAISWLSAT